MKHSEKETALLRWSRLKEESRQTATSDPNNAGVDQAALTNENALEKSNDDNKVDINLLTDADMPDVETLNEESDYSGFLSKNVSEGLRKIALRKLFQGKAYNICDGLDDYDGIYTKFEKLDPGIITADMKHRLEIEAKKKLEQLADNESEESIESVDKVDSQEEQLAETDQDIVADDTASDGNEDDQAVTGKAVKT